MGRARRHHLSEFRKSNEELEKIFKQLIAKMSKPGQENAIFSEITDADIDNLFSES